MSLLVKKEGVKKSNNHEFQCSLSLLFNLRGILKVIKVI